MGGFRKTSHAARGSEGHCPGKAALCGVMGAHRHGKYVPRNRLKTGGGERESSQGPGPMVRL